MSIRLAQIEIPSPILLAPMAGITDLPFRKMVARFGAGLLVSEMVASGEMITAKPSVRAKARIDLGLDAPGPGAHPARPQPAHSVQLAGREPGPMAEAARLLQDLGAPVIDINMGCPAKKVTGGLSGSALMRDPDLALSLISAVRGAVSVPVTVKMRLGWCDDSRNAAQIAQAAEQAGVAMLVVHGRTRMQFYKGRADWQAIAAVVQAVSIPVIANGDVVDTASARAALAASGAAGLMVGRGAQGAPWRLAELAHGLGLGPAPDIPQGSTRADLVAEHYEAILDFYGQELGLRIARKHLGWYVDEAGAEPGLRGRLMAETRPAAVLALIQSGIGATDAGTEAAARALRQAPGRAAGPEGLAA